MATAVMAEGVRKRFRSTQALDGFALEVPAGAVCGLLGPNGAGKTTVVRILSTLLRADGGRAEVAGLDVATRAREVRARIGLTSQHDAVDEVLTGRQNLELFARLQGLAPRAARVRAGELLEQFGLTEAADRAAKQYSGGMRRRLDLAAGFVTAPAVVFLDEPTTGQDPRNRNEVWDVVRRLVAGGTTVLLTTHYLDEADQLAGQISLIDRGRVIAEGSRDELKARLGGDQNDLTLRHADYLSSSAEVLARFAVFF
jgi:ABC-2 type transport system ATP-binding protein